jgi:hypothetical protein
MTKKNVSELLFEEFCAKAGIQCRSIPTEKGARTPDYELILTNQTLIAEVKEIERNKEEIESDRLLEQRGYGNAIGGVPGQRVRQKIQSCSSQIKARSCGVHPSLLVLYECHFAAVNIEPYHIRVAMYGLETFVLAVPESGRPYIIDKKFGPRQKMTQIHNTSISAIATIRKIYTSATDCGVTYFYVYHNKYAAIPLDADLLKPYGVTQFRIGEAEVGFIPEWEQIA